MLDLGGISKENRVVVHWQKHRMSVSIGGKTDLEGARPFELASNGERKNADEELMSSFVENSACVLSVICQKHRRKRWATVEIRRFP